MKTKDLQVGTEYVFGAAHSYRRRLPLRGILITKDPYTTVRRHEFNPLLQATVFPAHPTHKEWGEHGALAFAVRLTRRVFDNETQQPVDIVQWLPMVVQPGQVFNTAASFDATAEEREAEEQAKRAAQQAEYDRQRAEIAAERAALTARVQAVSATLERKGVSVTLNPWSRDGSCTVPLEWLEKVAGQLRTKRAVQAA